MKRVIIIHGWDGHPDECWFPWLKRELESRGFVVTVPQMPKPEAPEIGTWVAAIAEAVGTPDVDTFLVAHSIGANATVRYLASIDEPIGGLVCVAGWFSLVKETIGSEEDEGVAEPWLTSPIDFEKAKANARKVVALFSDDDKYVPLENIEVFRQRLGADIVLLRGRGHMGDSDDATEVPEILSAVTRISSAQ